MARKKTRLGALPPRYRFALNPVSGGALEPVPALPRADVQPQVPAHDPRGWIRDAGAGQDLPVLRVETGVRFTNDYGDIDGGFHVSMVRMYASALEWIAKHDLKSRFEERCARIVEDSRGTGWGFHDALADDFQQFFDGPDD